MCGAVLMVDLGKTKAEKKQEKEKAAKADDPKAGADAGKIVNLMAGDANCVSKFSFLCLEIGSRNRTARSHKPYLDFIFSTEVPSSPFTLPNSCLLTYNPCSTIRDPDGWCVLVPVRSYPHPSPHE